MPEVKYAEGGGPTGTTALRSSPQTIHAVCQMREGSADGKVELPVLRPDQEAFPFMAVEDVGLLAAIL